MSETAGTIRVVRSRKVHHCIWCPERIKKGHPHVKMVGVDEWLYKATRYHDECYKVMEALEDLDQISPSGFKPHIFKRGTAQLL